MEHILPAYNDPLFSILLIISLGLIVSILTYGWSLYQQQKEEGNLLKFLDKFDSSECALDTQDMPYEEHMLKPLTLLAHAFENSGEYHKAISIYLYLIKNIPDKMGNVELMQRLGRTYLHAGFLERARSIYLDILSKKPRNTKVLYELGIVYELMHDYTKARETIEPLTLLHEDTYVLEKRLAFLETTGNKNLSIEHKISKLKSLLEEEPKLYREVVSSVLNLNTYEAWQIIDTERVKEILDVLWHLPNSQLDLDIITENRQLNTLFYAKGYLQKASDLVGESGIFSLDMLAKARQNGFHEGDLSFSYLCKKCKQSFPMSFKRCPNCMSMHTVEVEEHIEKASPKTDYSLL